MPTTKPDTFEDRSVQFRQHCLARLSEAPIEEAVAILRHLAIIIPVEVFGVPIDRQAEVLLELGRSVDTLISSAGLEGTRIDRVRKSGSVAQLVFEMRAQSFPSKGPLAGDWAEILDGLDSVVRRFASFIETLRDTPAWGEDSAPRKSGEHFDRGSGPINDR